MLLPKINHLSKHNQGKYTNYFEFTKKSTQNLSANPSRDTPLHLSAKQIFYSFVACAVPAIVPLTIVIVVTAVTSPTGKDTGNVNTTPPIKATVPAMLRTFFHHGGVGDLILSINSIFICLRIA